MRKKRINKLRFNRLVVGSAGLYRHLVVLVVSILIFAVGFGISFNRAISPVLVRFSEAWEDTLAYFIAPDQLPVFTHFIGGGLLLFGLYLAYVSIKGFIATIVGTLTPSTRGGMVNVYLQRQKLARGPKIVTLGGGTGLSTLLRGLKQHSSNITAVVTVTDDGGSSGRLKEEMGIIPPGDMRNCLVALADAEARMTDLFQHRFKDKSGSLSGHSVGNLLLAGLVEQAGGDVDGALRAASDVLAIRGRVLPSTTTQVQLRALMEDGTEICGETRIVGSKLRIRRMFLDPENAKPHPEALRAIQEADLIVIGPGSVYTSVIPNLLVPGISEALNEAKGHKVYVSNVMTQHGESDAFTAAEHVVAIQANVDQRVCDSVLVNTAMPSQSAIEKYREFEQSWVQPDVDRIRTMGFKVIQADVMSETDYVRHDPIRLASILLEQVYKK
jgi:uncharacterized cofD-like protein